MLVYKIFFILIFLASVHYAVSIDVQLPNATCNDTLSFVGSIQHMHQCISESLYTDATNGAIFAAQQFYNSVFDFVVSTPDIKAFCTSYQGLMAILESFYSIMVMGLGAYYIIHSSDVEGRMKAKNWFKNILYMVVFLSFSFILFGILLDLNTQLSSSFYSSANSKTFDIKATENNLFFAFVFAIGLLLNGGLAFVTLLVRYILIPFLLFIFPIGIFLYFIPSTRQWGSFIFTILLLIVFMTTLDSIFIFGFSTLLSSADPIFSDPTLRSWGLIAGFGLIGIVNLIIYVIAILTIISRATSVIAPLVSPTSRAISFFTPKPKGE